MSQGKSWWRETLLTLGIVTTVSGAGYGGYEAGKVLHKEAKQGLNSIPCYDLSRWFAGNASVMKTPANNNAVFETPKIV